MSDTAEFTIFIIVSNSNYVLNVGWKGSHVVKTGIVLQELHISFTGNAFYSLKPNKVVRAKSVIY